MTALFRKVDCLSIPVPDLDAALSFYSRQLGHELVLHTDGRPLETDLSVQSVPEALVDR